ncbi:MAG: hypothetical protein ACOX1O_08495 [Eggerthellaceae bacterium]
MAQDQDDFKLISVNDDEDDIVFHAGIRPDSSHRQTGADPDSNEPQAAETSIPSEPVGSHTDEAASVPAGEGSRREAPMTAQERQRARENERRRQQAAEIAATEEDLEKAGRMGKGQIAIIICCLVLLVVTIVYVVWTFIS